MLNTIDVLILNRNLRIVTDNLVRDVRKYDGINFCGVIDSGSRIEEQSTHTVVISDKPAVIEKGLRLNRGYNLGIDWWLRSKPESNWLMLLPNDSEVVKFDVDAVLALSSKITNLAAIVPLSPSSHYINNFDEHRYEIAWHFDEGPIIFSRHFLNSISDKGTELFDNDNFRGYLSFIELATKIYASNKCMAATDLISFKENKSHTIKKYELIGTEPYDSNIELMLSEGKDWLLKKYGFEDRKSLELISRLLYEEFRSVNEGRLNE